jgi:hypothetical protein
MLTIGSVVEEIWGMFSSRVIETFRSVVVVAIGPLHRTVKTHSLA